MVFKTESAFMQDIGDLKKYYTSISDRTKNSGSNTAAVKWMYMMGVEPTAFRLGGECSILLSYRDLYEIELVTITFGFELIG